MVRRPPPSREVALRLFHMAERLPGPTRGAVTDLPDGRPRLVGASLVDSVADRDAFVASGMESGVREGYDELDAVLAT